MFKINRAGLAALVTVALVLALHQPIASYFCNIAAPFSVLDQVACPVYFGVYGIRFIALGTATLFGIIVLAAVATRMRV